MDETTPETETTSNDSGADNTPSGDESDNSPAPTPAAPVQSSLTSLASSAIAAIGGAATQAIAGNITRSSNTAPTPDITAKAATPSAVRTAAGIAGLSLPVLAAIGIVAFLVLGRKGA